MPKPLFAIYDFNAVRFISGRPEAWEFWGGEWHKMDSAVAHHRAGLLTEQAYMRMFGPGSRQPVPPLPDHAFRGDPWQRAKRPAIGWRSPLV
jgi:hypothetical protein